MIPIENFGKFYSNVVVVVFWGSPQGICWYGMWLLNALGHFISPMFTGFKVCCFKPKYCLINSQAVASSIEQTSQNLLCPCTWDMSLRKRCVISFGMVCGQPNVVMVKLHSL